MTKLSTYLPLETIKQSKKLQEIKSREWYKSAITIADVINNSKELFGEDRIGIVDNEIKATHGRNYYCKGILDMCFDNESINEISEFIIKNIKE